MARKPKDDDKKTRSKGKNKAAGRGGAKGYAEENRYHSCMLPIVPPRPLPPEMHPGRLSLIRINEKKWVNGTVLHYYFFDRSSDGGGRWKAPKAQMDAVRNAFQEWKDLGVGLKFEEVGTREEAEIRIGFDRNDGSWSYVGRDIIDVASNPNERTMNFGWDLTTPYGHDTALHEIGHTLGFPHEHQNPLAGIEWDEQAVIDYFRGSPNFWPEETTRWNILRKIPQGDVSGSTWDPDSVMHYNIDAGLIVRPEEYSGGVHPAGGLSQKDIDTVRQFYPPLEDETEPELKVFESQMLSLAPGEQVNFRIKPTFSRNYTIQTFGESDTVMVLFEDDGGNLLYLDGDDDSGWQRNARIETRLHRNREYVVRVRLYYGHLSGESALMLW